MKLSKIECKEFVLDIDRATDPEVRFFAPDGFSAQGIDLGASSGAILTLCGPDQLGWPYAHAISIALPVAYRGKVDRVAAAINAIMGETNVVQLPQAAE